MSRAPAYIVWNTSRKNPEEEIKEKEEKILSRVTISSVEVTADLFDFDVLRLATFHPHPRDKRILFNERMHRYFVRWTEGLDAYSCHDIATSVSGFVHDFFGHFDADKVLTKMMANRRKFESGKYSGMSADDIKQQWAENGHSAQIVGTVWHSKLEHYYNGKDFSEEDKAHKIYTQFLDYKHKEVDAERLQVFRTEWRMMSDESLYLTGTLDIIFAMPDQCDDHLLLSLRDWKISKEIKRSNLWQKGLGVCAGLQDCNYEHYRLAMLSYKHLLETFYHDVSYNGKVYSRVKVVEMSLAVFHESRETYERVDFSLDGRDLEAMLDVRRAKVSEWKGKS
jgi:hypothetical protein